MLADASTWRYGRRFRMQHLEHAGAGLSSGLLQVPTLQCTRSRAANRPAAPGAAV